MANKTKDIITKTLECKGELNSIQIMKELEDKDHQITHDTLAKNLKEMINSDDLIRYGKKKKQDIAWYYYYNLNTNK